MPQILQCFGTVSLRSFDRDVFQRILKLGANKTQPEVSEPSGRSNAPLKCRGATIPQIVLFIWLVFAYSF